jgi:hypothetical protein
MEGEVEKKSTGRFSIWRGKFMRFDLTAKRVSIWEDRSKKSIEKSWTLTGWTDLPDRENQSGARKNRVDLAVDPHSMDSPSAAASVLELCFESLEAKRDWCSQFGKAMLSTSAQGHRAFKTNNSMRAVVAQHEKQAQRKQNEKVERGDFSTWDDTAIRESAKSPHTDAAAAAHEDKYFSSDEDEAVAGEAPPSPQRRDGSAGDGGKSGKFEALLEGAGGSLEDEEEVDRQAAKGMHAVQMGDLIYLEVRSQHALPKPRATAQRHCAHCALRLCTTLSHCACTSDAIGTPHS